MKEKDLLEECSNREYCIISKRVISGGHKLLSNYKNLKLYSNMEENTTKLLENIIEKNEMVISLTLAYEGDYKEVIASKDKFSDFIMNNKDKIIAIYKYVTSTETRHYFINISQEDIVYNYDYLYLSFARLLELLEDKNIGICIDNTYERCIPGIQRDDDMTYFSLDYDNIRQEGETVVRRK